MASCSCSYKLNSLYIFLYFLIRACEQHFSTKCNLISFINAMHWMQCTVIQLLLYFAVCSLQFAVCTDVMWCALVECETRNTSLLLYVLNDINNWNRFLSLFFVFSLICFSFFISNFKEIQFHVLFELFIAKFINFYHYYHCLIQSLIFLSLLYRW